MAAQEHRRVVNQQGLVVPERDKLFGEMLRRLLLKAVSMVEDYYDLKRVNQNRRSVPLR